MMMKLVIVCIAATLLGGCAVSENPTPYLGKWHHSELGSHVGNRILEIRPDGSWAQYRFVADIEGAIKGSKYSSGTWFLEGDTFIMYENSPQPNRIAIFQAKNNKASLAYEKDNTHYAYSKGLGNMASDYKALIESIKSI